MHNSLWVGGSIGRRGFPMLGTGKRGLSTYIKDIFKNGEQGFFYDPSDLKTQYQDAAGTTVVNATGQPLGLLLDKGKGLALGPELIINGNFSDSSNWFVTNSDDTHFVDFTADGARFYSATNTPIMQLRPSATLVPGKWYRIAVTTAGNVVGAIKSDGFTPGNLVLSGAQAGTYVTYGQSKGSALFIIRNSAVVDLTIKSMSVKEIQGNHAYQTTSAARPLFRQKPILGSELVVNGDFSNGTTGWAITAGNFTVIDGRARVVYPVNGGIYKDIPVIAGKTYEVSFKVENISGPSGQLYLYDGAGFTSTLAFSGYKSVRVTPTRSTLRVYGYKPGAGEAYWDDISVKEVIGYHTDQNYIEYDGVDDKLITNLPSELTNCTVLRAIPDVGTQVKYNQTLPMLYEDSTNHSGLVAIDRALTRKEQLRLMEELDKRAGATSLETLTFKTFDNNQEGFVYDPNDLSTMYQDSTGIVPVTSIGQPVGLLLDKSKGLVLGPNQISYPNSEELPASVSMSDGAYTWTLNTNAPISGTQDSRLVVTVPASTSTRPSLAFHRSSPLVPDRLYKFSFRYKVNSGAPRVVAVYKGDGTISITPDKGTLQGSGTFDISIRWVAGDQTRPYVYFSNESVFDLQIDDISVREVKGNHAYQTTSASRPILRQNATTGAYYLEFDGVDDHLLSSLGGVTSDITTGHACEVLSNLTKTVFSGGLYGYLRTHSGFASVYSSTPNMYPRNKKDVLVQKIVNGQHTLTTNLGGGDASSSIESPSTQFWRPYSSADSKIIGNFSATHTSLAAAMNYYGGFFITKGMTSLEETAFRNLFNKRMGN